MLRGPSLKLAMVISPGMLSELRIFAWLSAILGSARRRHREHAKACLPSSTLSRQTVVSITFLHRKRCVLLKEVALVSPARAQLDDGASVASSAAGSGFSFPWDELMSTTLRALMRDLEVPNYVTKTRSEMLALMQAGEVPGRGLHIFTWRKTKLNVFM